MYERDLAAYTGCFQVRTREGHGSRIGAIDTGEHLDDGRLARSIFAEKRHDLALIHAEAHIGRGAGRKEGFREPCHLEQGDFSAASYIERHRGSCPVAKVPSCRARTPRSATNRA